MTRSSDASNRALDPTLRERIARVTLDAAEADLAMAIDNERAAQLVGVGLGARLEVAREERADHRGEDLGAGEPP